MHKLFIQAASAMCLVAACCAARAEIVVIVNPKSAAANMTAEQVANVYLGKDTSYAAVDLPESAALREEFYKKATQVAVELTIGAGVLSLEVADNGRGMTELDRAKTRSFGLRGLHERAATVGGWVDLSSGPRGTSLILSVPLTAAAAAEPAPDEHEEPDNRAHDPSAWTPL